MFPCAFSKFDDLINSKNQFDGSFDIDSHIFVFEGVNSQCIIFKVLLTHFESKIRNKTVLWSYIDHSIVRTRVVSTLYCSYHVQTSAGLPLPTSPSL